MPSPPPDSAAQHGTLVLGCRFDVPPARLYAAISDPLERALVGTLGDAQIRLLDESDFRVGGRDFFRFGLKGAPAFRAEAIFHRIVPQALIVSTEIVHTGETCVSVELVSLTLAGRGDATHLKLTTQFLSLGADEDLADAASSRHQALLDALTRHLGTPPRDRGRAFSRRRR